MERYSTFICNYYLPLFASFYNSYKYYENKIPLHVYNYKRLNTFNIQYVFLNCKINNIIAQKLYKSFGFEKYGSNDVDDVLIYKIPKQ